MCVCVRERESVCVYNFNFFRKRILKLYIMINVWKKKPVTLKRNIT